MCTHMHASALDCVPFQLSSLKNAAANSRSMLPTLPVVISPSPCAPHFWPLSMNCRSVPQGQISSFPHLHCCSEKQYRVIRPPQCWVDQRFDSPLVKGHWEAEHVQSIKWSLLWANCSTWTPLQIIVFNYHLCTPSHATYWCKITTTLV